MSIGLRIKQLRIDKGLSQQAFASSIGIKRANLGQIEAENQLPTLKILSNIVRIYNTSYSYIIEGTTEDKMHTNNAHLDAHLSSEKVTSNGNPGGNVKVSDLKRQISQKEEIIAALRSSESALREANKDKEVLIGYLQKEISVLTNQINDCSLRINELKEELSDNLCSECRKKRKVG